MLHFNLNFNELPRTPERQDEWRLFCYLWAANNWPDPAYYLARWAQQGLRSDPDFRNAFDRWMQIAHSSSGTQVNK